MLESPRAAVRVLTPWSKRPLAVFVLLLALTALLTVAQYSLVARITPGILHLSDDAVLLNQVRNGLTRDTFFVIYSEHLMPGTFALYYAVYSLVGVAWTLYGSLLLAAHATLCALVGFTIWRFGRSLFVTLMVVIPLTLSYSFASGVLIQFVNVQQHWYYSGFLLAVLLLKRFFDTGSWRAYVAMLGIGMMCLLITTPGIVVVPVLGIFFVAFRVINTNWSGSLWTIVRPRRRDIAVILAIASLVATYLAILAISVYGYGHGLPGRSVHGPPTPEPLYIRIMQAVSYGFVGLLPHPRYESNAWMPTLLTSHAAVYLAISVIAVVTALIGWRFVLAIRRSDRAAQLTLGAALAAITVAVAYAVVATTGRQFLTYWHFRYNGTSVVFSTIAIGLALSYLFRTLPTIPRNALSVALAVASVGLAAADAVAVRGTTMFEQRLVADRWWDEYVYSSWPEAGTVEFAPIDLARTRRASPPAPQQISPGEPVALTLSGPDVDASQPTRLVAHEDGRYLVLGNIAFEDNPQGFRRLRLMQNGDAMLTESLVQGANGGPTMLNTMRALDLARGDFVELVVQHSSDRALNAFPFSTVSPALALVRLPEGASLAATSGQDGETLEGLGLDVAAALRVEPGQLIPEEYTWKLAFDGVTVDPTRFEVTTQHALKQVDELFLGAGTRYSALTAQADGVYLVLGSVVTDARRDGFRRTSLTLNERTSLVAKTIARAPEPARATLAGLVEVKRGDVVRILGNFSTGTMQTAARNREHERATPAEAGSAPAARVIRSDALTVQSGQPTVVPFDRLSFGSERLYDPVAFPSRLTVETPGRYFMVGEAAFRGQNRGERRAEIVQNGDTVVASTTTPGRSGEFTALAVFGLRDLAAGDFIELRVSQTSGRPLELLRRPSFSPELMLVRAPPGLETIEALADHPAAVTLTRAAELALMPERQTPIPFDQRPPAADELLMTSDNGSTITIQESGLYLLTGSVQLTPTEGGRRELSIVRNELDTLVAQNGETNLAVATVAWLTDGDIVELRALQTSPGPLDLVPSSQRRAALTLTRVS